MKNPIVLNKNSNEWSKQELKDLSNEYGVSKESLLLRLIHTGKAYPNSYEILKKDFKFKSNKKSFGGGSPVLNQIKYHGTLYSRLMLNAYEMALFQVLNFHKTSI